MAALRKYRWLIVVALLALVAVASTMTYAGFLVIGELAYRLGTGRFLAGLLLALVFARFPSLSKGKVRMVGLLPKPVRRPVMLALLAFCLWSFLSRGDTTQAVFTGLAGGLLLAFPWIRRALLGRLTFGMFAPVDRQHRENTIDSGVIDVEFREKKD